MNEPFLLSNLVELQDLDNKIYKLIDSKSNSENVLNLKTLELSYKKLLEEDRIDVEPIWYDAINEIDVRDWLELRGKNPLIEEL